MAEEWVRWNTHLSDCVDVELFGTTLKLRQDPNSLNLGTTVWDSSIVFANFLEKNSRKGEFARQRLKGKQAIELGAGMGLCSLAFAAMGCDVLSTDVKSVVPLLSINCASNLNSVALDGLPWAKEAGRVVVQELDWYDKEQRESASTSGPFHYLLAADCVYNEEHLQAFKDTCEQLMDKKSLLVVINELRSESVQTQFLAIMAGAFTHKRIPHSKMGSAQHQLIDIYLFKKLKA